MVELFRKKLLIFLRPAIVNVHPSLLPKYRAQSPIESAILNGDENRVSLMKLSKEMDAGDVYSQEEIELSKTETASGLYKTCGEIGAEMLCEIYQKLFLAKLKDKQDDSQTEYCQLLKKAMLFFLKINKLQSRPNSKFVLSEIFPKVKLSSVVT